MRFTARHKAVILYALNKGHMTEEQVCREYNSSHEEIAEWQRKFNAGGVRALKVNLQKESKEHPMYVNIR